MAWFYCTYAKSKDIPAKEQIIRAPDLPEAICWAKDSAIDEWVWEFGELSQEGRDADKEIVFNAEPYSPYTEDHIHCLAQYGVIDIKNNKNIFKE